MKSIVASARAFMIDATKGFGTLCMGPLARIDYAKAGLRRALLTARVLIRDRIEQRLPLIAAPTLVLHGSRDPVSPQQWAEVAARLLPRGRLVVVAGRRTVEVSGP